MELGETPLENIRRIERLSIDHPRVKIAVFTDKIDKSYVLRAFQAGASGYMLKEMDFPFNYRGHQTHCSRHFLYPAESYSPLNKCIFIVQSEREHKGVFKQEETRMPFHLLTKRECEVLQLLADGNSRHKISVLLSISDKTVKNHVSSIFEKMNVVHRTKAVVTAIKYGWVKLI